MMMINRLNTPTIPKINLDQDPRQETTYTSLPVQQIASAHFNESPQEDKYLLYCIEQQRLPIHLLYGGTCKT